VTKKSLPPDRFDWGITGGMRCPRLGGHYASPTTATSQITTDSCEFLQLVSSEELDLFTSSAFLRWSQRGLPHLHNTKTPLAIWFWAAYLMTTDKRGVSALFFQGQLGLKRYETAWMMLS
jgi:hypothetical protein